MCAFEGQSPTRHGIEHRRQDKFNAGNTGWRGREIALSRLFFSFGEWCVVRGDVVDHAIFNGLPQCILIFLVANGRIYLGVDPSAGDVFFGGKQVLGRFQQ